MPPRVSLKEFLAMGKTVTQGAIGRDARPLHFVVGNESADLDSLCSAIVYAYHNTYTPPHTLHVPVSNLPRSDLNLRPELTAALRHAGLTPADLITLSELPDLSPPTTRWLLVDHNALTGALKKFAGQVLGCIDHHEDEGVVAQECLPRVIEPCGSCMSLVVEQTRGIWDEAASSRDENAAENAIDEELAKLALAPILTDTVNLTSEDKTTDKDWRAVQFLESRIQDRNYDRTRYFDEIIACKEDISHLSFRDLFRKDYKEWNEASLKVGISCIVQNFEYLLEKQEAEGVDFLSELAAWLEERQLDIAAVMTTSHSGGNFKRQLLLWGGNHRGAAAVQKFIALAGNLGLESWNQGALDLGEVRYAWDQARLDASRKKVAPLLREAMRSA